MIVHDVAQGSSEWFALRLGIPTASRFGSIIQPKKLGYSTAARGYACELLAEKLLGYSLDSGDYEWTERGTEYEDKARLAYEFEREVEVVQVGFCTDDEKTEGGSPDGLVGLDPVGGLAERVVEIKVRSAKHHMRRLMGLEPIADPCQVQGLLRITGADVCECWGWNPPDPNGAQLPPVLEVVERDEEFQAALDECLERFKAELEKGEHKLRAMGPRGRIIDPRDDDSLLARLTLSLIDNNGVLSPDEIDELRKDLDWASKNGVLDASDVRQILDDAVAGKTDDVQRMWDYVKRHQPVEAT